MYIYNKLYFQYKKLYSTHIKKIVKILNQIHEKQYNEDYWEPIVGLYVRRFILNFIFLKKINKKNLFFNKVNFKRANFYKSHREFADNYYFEPIDRKYINKIEGSLKFKDYKIKRLNIISKIINFFKIFILNLLINLDITKIVFFESYFKKNLKRSFSFKTLFYFYSLPNLSLEDYKIDKEKIFNNRHKLILNFKLQSQKDLILKNLIFSMPINYIENFKNIHDEVEKINLSKAIYIDGNEINLDTIKFYIAKLKLNKRKIISGQHSLRTGIQDYDSYFDYLKSISSLFLTWGWKNNISKVRKFSSLRIFSSVKKYKKVEKIDNKVSKICFMLCGYSQVGECLYENFIENQKAEKSRINLLKSLVNIKQNNIFLKPRIGSFILDKKNKFYKKFNILKDKTRMYEIFSKFNIVIFERMSLGTVECIYLNQPTAIYYPKNLYSMKNKQYKDLIFLLKKANIYFDDINQLKKIIGSKNKINQWWFNSENIKNRKKILNQYARVFKYSDINEVKKVI